MPKYVFMYQGSTEPVSDEDRNQVMAEWGAWFEQMGPAVVDGGNPVSHSMSVTSPTQAAPSNVDLPLSGYTLVEADSMEKAVSLAQGCPIFKSGGQITVGEAIDMAG